MSTHYETLGVESNATPEQIRDAYRRKSSEHHPDRGGDPEAMKAVNAANDVLRDEARRARYDAGGADSAPTTLEEEATRDLLTVLDAVIESETDALLPILSSPLERARTIVVASLNERLRLHMEGAQMRGKLLHRSNRTRRKKGSNLVQMVIDSKLKEVESLIRVNKQKTDVLEEMLRQLDDHEEITP